MSISFVSTKDELVWMVQHIGTNLWSVGADNHIHAWNLVQVTADKGIFPFNIHFICKHKITLEDAVFTMRDINDCLFHTQEAAAGRINESEAVAI